jgi:hypothetical protein
MSHTFSGGAAIWRVTESAQPFSVVAVISDCFRRHLNRGDIDSAHLHHCRKSAFDDFAAGAHVRGATSDAFEGGIAAQMLPPNGTVSCRSPMPAMIGRALAMAA